MTVLAGVCLLSLLLMCRARPELALLPKTSHGHRILLTPFLEWCSGILVTCGLAALALAGCSIAVAILVVFLCSGMAAASSRGAQDCLST